MTYIVNDKCINCRYTDCVEVCPVDCFYIGENSVVINPDECIDCGVCEPECPADAIVPDTDMTSELQYWLNINTKYSEVWPNITKKLDPMPDADALNPAKGYSQDKTKDFSTKPGAKEC
jgi:ferredoxin